MSSAAAKEAGSGCAPAIARPGLIPCALLALAACGGADAPQPEVYRHSLPGVPAGLDPAHSADAYAGFLVQNLFQTLYAYRYLSRPYRLAPELAADLPEISADGLSVRIGIRPGQRFADDPAFDGGRGREVTAADFVYSLKRHFDPETRSRGRWLWRGRIEGLDEWAEAGADYDAPVTGLRALDDHRLEIRLTAPYPQLAHTLANPLAAVVPREAVAAYGREFGIRPVGSGPYRLEAVDSARAVLMRNPNFGPVTADLAAQGYREAAHGRFGLAAIDGLELPVLPRVVVEFIPDDAARWVSFNSAGGSEFVRLPADQIGQVLADPEAGLLRPAYRDRYRALPAPELGFVRIDFNLADPGLGQTPDPDAAQRHRALRCALAGTIDWSERNRVFYQGMGIVLDALAPPGAGFERTAPPPARPALAALDLGEAPALNYGHLAGIRGTQEYEYFRDGAIAAGYPADRVRGFAYPNLADMARAIEAAEINVYMLGWVMDYPDALNNFELFYGPNALPGANYSQYRNDKYDALFEQAARLAPSAARDQALQGMQAILDHDCVTVPGLTRRSVFLFSSALAIYPDNGPVNGGVLRYAARLDEKAGR